MKGGKGRKEIMGLGEQRPEAHFACLPKPVMVLDVNTPLVNAGA